MRRRWFSFRFKAIGQLLLLLMCGQLFAATEIPFEFRNGIIWMKVRVPDRQDSLDFILDSGASASIVDLQAARRLGVRLGSPLTVQGVHSQSIAYRAPGLNAETGGVPLPRSLLALDLSPISAASSQRVDGLLGADFFRGRIVQIDFSRGKVRLLERGELSANNCEVLPLSLRNNAMCVRMSVAGAPASWMRVDTGCNSALQWAPGGNDQTRVSSSARTISADIQLGSQRMESVKTGIHAKPMFAGEAGLLGNGVLSRFSTVTFDMSSRRLLLAGR